ncbi:cilia- and flagella-associated protein 20-like [Cimex lectularius]|uniref:CFA20 domain-containing protein n=1 Tax=Cimex lectularius TaxID=79782 RepID=A0A8I6SR19_CIMLE|nr:cilia- and flagella-associated protein 20-like [Cimex lectularius]
MVEPALQESFKLKYKSWVLDNHDIKRKFTLSNFKYHSRIRPFECWVPIGLTTDWNEIQFSLADLTRKAYGTEFVECTRVHIHANCRLRRLYFADKVYNESDLPKDYKLYLPDVHH